MLERTIGSESERGAERPFRSNFFRASALLAVYFCLLSVNSLPADQLLLLPTFLVVLSAPIWLRLPAGKHFQLSLISVLSIAALVLLVAHGFFSDWPWMSLWLGWCLALLHIGVLVGGSAPVGRSFEVGFLISVIAVGTVNAIYVTYLAQVEGGRPGGFLDDPNLGADIIGIAVLCAAYLYLAKGASHWILVCVALMSVALFFAQSRGAWIALICSGSVLSLFFLLSGQRPRQRLVFFGLAVLGGFVAALLFTGVGLAESVGVGERSKSLGYRFEMWASSWELVVQRPLFGSGIGTFPLRYPAVRSPLEIATTGHFAHSDIIQLVVELGLIGALLFISAPLLFVFSFVKNTRMRGVSFGLPLLAFSVLLLVGLHGLVNFIIYQPLVALTVGLLIGLGSRDLVERVRVSFELPLHRMSMVFSLFFLVVLSVMSAADLIASKKTTQISQSASQYNLQSKAYYDLLFLEMFSPLNVNIKNYIIEAEVSSAMGLVGSDVGLQFRKKIIDRIDRNRWLYEPNCVQLAERGRLIWLDDKNRAVSALESLIEAAPNCYRAHLYLSEAYLDQQRFADAEKLLEKAFNRFKFGEVDQKQASALLDGLAEVLRRQGREAEARSIEAFSRYD